jgi:hypothetical protein
MSACDALLRTESSTASIDGRKEKLGSATRPWSSCRLATMRARAHDEVSRGAAEYAGMQIAVCGLDHGELPDDNAEQWSPKVQHW